MKKVCIIGAGGAGLAALRHVNASSKLSGVCFESMENIGGLWNYTDQVGNDNSGLPVHSTIYKGLRTNLPKQIMGYLDFNYKEGGDSFIYHEEVLQFMRDFAEQYKLLENIQFNTRVVSIRPINRCDFSNEPLWEVAVQRGTDDKVSTNLFDSVMICNGHYWKSTIPSIKNLDEFKGQVMHSRDYRVPEPFTGKRVVVFGCGPSGIDIMLEVAKVASEIHLSLRKPPFPGNLPANVNNVFPVTQVRDKYVIFENGDEVECDVLLLCSGYDYDIPFLTPECGIQIEKGKLIHPLYRHLINAKFPTMSIFGVAFIVCPFILFDAQTRYFVKYLEGEVTLPSMDQMLLDIEENTKRQKEKGIPFHRSHELGELQWDYYKSLCDEAGVSHLIKPYVRKIFEAVGHRRLSVPEVYKNDNIIVLDDDNFILEEASS